MQGPQAILTHQGAVTRRPGEGQTIEKNAPYAVSD